MVNQEQVSSILYKKHQISEWREKCFILSPKEQEEIFNNLRAEIEGPLVLLAKLPFPQFVTEYYKRFPNRKKEADDPSIGYKMFLMRDPILKFFANYLKNESSQKQEPNVSSNIIKEIDFYLNTPLDEIYKNPSILIRNTDIKRKTLYIFQYIDEKEAEKLDLKSLRTPNGYKGFEFEEKINSFNTFLKIIIQEFLGFFGQKNKSANVIAEEKGLSHIEVHQLLSCVIWYMFEDTKKFRRIIGLKEETLRESQTREYKNTYFKKLDLSLQTRYILMNVLTKKDRKVLEKYSMRDIGVYIARKFFFNRSEDVSRYLSVPMETVKKMTF